MVRRPCCMHTELILGAYWTNANQGAFNNHVDRFLPIFDHPLTCSAVDSPGHLADHLPFVHVDNKMYDHPLPKIKSILIGFRDFDFQTSSTFVFNLYAIRSRFYTHYLMKHSGEEFFLEFTICNYLFII